MLEERATKFCFQTLEDARVSAFQNVNKGNEEIFVSGCYWCITSITEVTPSHHYYFLELVGPKYGWMKLKFNANNNPTRPPDWIREVADQLI